MKIRVDLSELLDSTLNGHLTFRNQNTEVIKGWIKKIYGIDASLRKSENGEYPICTEYELLREE